MGVAPGRPVPDRGPRPPSRQDHRRLRTLRSVETAEGQEPAARAGDAQLLGFALLEELRDTLGEEEIASYLADYVALTGWDARSQQLFHAIGDEADLRHAFHRDAVLNWLRAWGCRHLRRVDSEQTGEAVRSWWEAWGPQLPGRGAGLTDLDAAALSAVAPAYDELRTARAAVQPLGEHQVDVLFGDTAAAKTLFALRPAIFPPWDDPIRLSFGWWGGGEAYVELVGLVAETLRLLAARLGSSVAGLPGLFGRPQSTPPKLVDEYLWVRVTKAH
jgi:hypothetical protein